VTARKRASPCGSAKPEPLELSLKRKCERIMRNWLKKKWVRRIALGTGICLAFALIGCLYFRITGWKDVIAYIGMYRECPAMWKDLAFQRVRYGDRLEEFTTLHQPALTRTLGPYKVHTFIEIPPGHIAYTDLSITSKNGTIVRAEAWSCTWQYVFCSDPAEEAKIEAEYQRQYEKYREEDAERSKKTDRQLKSNPDPPQSPAAPGQTATPED